MCKFKCGICQKKSNDLWNIFGVEICEECFTTLVRVSQYKNPKDYLPDELNKIIAYLKLLLGQILKDKKKEKTDEI